MKSLILEQLKDSKDKKVIFYGASLFLKDFLKENNLKKYNIEGIVDANEKKWGSKFGDYKIYSPEILKKMQPVNIIFTVQNSHKSVYEQLKSMLENNVDLNSTRLYPDVFSKTNREAYLIGCNNAIKDATKNKHGLGFEFLTPTEKDIKELDSLGDDYRNYSEMNNQDRCFLYSIVRKYKPKKVLEVGVSKGASSYIILNALKDVKGAHLYSLDYMTDHYSIVGKKTGFYMDNHPELKKNWTLKTGGLSLNFMDEISSDKNEKEKFDFCFMDTSHTLPGEILDFLQVLPYLKKNCVFVLHDINFHSYAIKEAQYKDWYSNNILFSAIKGDKIIPDQSVYPFHICNILSNIGAVKLNKDTSKHLFDVFHNLTLPWKTIPCERDISQLLEFFKKHYHPYLTYFFNEAVELQRQFKEIN